MTDADSKLVDDLRNAAQYIHDRKPNPSKPPESSLYMRAAKRIEELCSAAPKSKEKSNGKQAPATE